MARQNTQNDNIFFKKFLPSTQNGSTVQQAGGRINNEVNASLVLSALSNELKDSLSRYEIPMAVALVDGPWTPETGYVPD